MSKLLEVALVLEAPLSCPTLPFLHPYTHSLLIISSHVCSSLSFLPSYPCLSLFPTHSSLFFHSHNLYHDPFSAFSSAIAVSFWLSSCSIVNVIISSLNISVFVSVSSPILFIFLCNLGHHPKLFVSSSSFLLLHCHSPTLLCLFFSTVLVPSLVLAWSLKTLQRYISLLCWAQGLRQRVHHLDVCLFSIQSIPSPSPPCFTHRFSLSHSPLNSWTPWRWDPNDLSVAWALLADT